MGNKIARIVLGIVIACALLFGIYVILPGQFKMPLTAYIQSSFNSNYDPIVNTLKDATVPKNKERTFDASMKAATKNSAWTIKPIVTDDAGNGSYEVYCDGYKCTVTFEKDNNSDSMMTHTNAHVRLVFRVTKNGSEIKIGDKVVETGKKAYPDEIIVDTSTYKDSDDNTYYQKTLNFLAGQ